MIPLVLPSAIGWGNYGGFEGPFYLGRVPWDPPDIMERSFLHKTLYVTTAAEGHADGYNGYDACIRSGGLIGWCDRATQFSYSDMLGLAAEREPAVLEELLPAMSLCGSTFQKNAAGKWRDFVGGVEVTTQPQQRALFLGCDGRIGSYGPAERVRAKTWAAACANVWRHPRALEAQVDFTLPRLMGFLEADVTKALFDDAPPSGWAGCVRAAAISYALNSPRWANDAVRRAIASTKATKWSPTWGLHVLRTILATGINTFPRRYETQRPVLQRLFGVALPDLAGLRAGVIPKQPVPVVAPVPAPPPDPVRPTEPTVPTFDDKTEIAQVPPEVRPPVQATTTGTTTTISKKGLAAGGVVAFLLAAIALLIHWLTGK